MGIIRRTKSVTALLSIFEHSDQAIKGVDLIGRLQGEMNKTTVYRILERLEDEGLLHSFTGKDGLKWFAQCRGCSRTAHHDTHPHFQCRYCGKTECLTMELAIPTGLKHKVESAELLLIGQCENCLS